MKVIIVMISVIISCTVVIFHLLPCVITFIIKKFWFPCLCKTMWERRKNSHNNLDKVITIEY